MTKSHALFRAFGLFLSVAALPSNAHAGPYLGSRWSEQKISQEDCLARAEKAILASGLEASPATTQSRYGVSEEYSGAVRCVMELNIVFFIASGPEKQPTDDLAGKLLEAF